MFRQHIIQGLMLKVLIGFKSFFVGIKKSMSFPVAGHIAHQPFFLAPVLSRGKRGM